MSSATLSKILKGHSNVTLDTIAEISEVTGLKIDLHIGSRF
jgi:transcriptional regulator with XRE-family HTH domain